MSIVWKNGQSPAINQSNLRANQQMLEDNADVLNVFEAMTDVASENTRDYPNDYYLINKQQINPINSALRMRGVTPSEVFKNIPNEILSIRGEGEEQLGAIEVDIVRNFEVIETENIEVNTSGIPHWHYQRTQFWFPNTSPLEVDDRHTVTIDGQNFTVGTFTQTQRYYREKSIWGPQPDAGDPGKIFETIFNYSVKYNMQGAPYQHWEETINAYGNEFAQGFSKAWQDLTEFNSLIIDNVVEAVHPIPLGEDISEIEAIKAIVVGSGQVAITLKQGYAIRSWGENSAGVPGILAQVEARDADLEIIQGPYNNLYNVFMYGGLGGNTATTETSGQWIEWLDLNEVLGGI